MERQIEHAESDYTEARQNASPDALVIASALVLGARLIAHKLESLNANRDSGKHLDEIAAAATHIADLMTDSVIR